jgi:hypothetical protein
MAKTPGEIELQNKIDRAIKHGDNITPILREAYGPAWDIMALTPEQEANRTKAMRKYWIANHPDERVPDILNR